MDFELSDEQRAFQQAAREFAANELAPHAAQWDAEAYFPRETIEHEQETCQRFPELALLAGAILTYAAATSPAVPTGSWDRQPRRTPGRLRRLLGQADFPTELSLPERLRGKVAVTDHLPKGWWGQRRPPTPTSAVSGSPDLPPASTEVA